MYINILFYACDSKQQKIERKNTSFDSQKSVEIAGRRKCDFEYRPFRLCSILPLAIHINWTKLNWVN